MKKKNTLISKPDKPESNNAELQSNPGLISKMSNNHKGYDHHTNSRTNKFPFGSIHGPLVF